MADIADRAQQQEEWHREVMIRDARRPLAPGLPGECDRCGEDMPRLVGGLCAPCRDGRMKLARRTGQ